MGTACEIELKNTGMTRREALQTVGVMAATVATAGTATSAMAGDGAAKTTAAARPANRIEVNHEWGTLKEVVCGIPHLVFPATVPKVFYNFMPAKGVAFFEKNRGKVLAEAEPELFKKQTAQMNAAAGILKKRGVKVYRPNAVNDKVVLSYQENIFPPSIAQMYPRDPMLVIGRHFIETSLMWPMRRRERFGIRPVIAERLKHSNAQVVAMPPAFPAKADAEGVYGPGPFIEGGDVFLLGRDIYVGHSGNATNLAGIQWLQQYLGDPYRVQKVPLSKKMLHLDCCLATPRPGLAIVCREGFKDGLPKFLSGWKLIDVSLEDAHTKMATNGLVIDRKTIMIASGLDDLAKALRAVGQTVIETPFDEIYFYGGSFRCWHHPLVRESKLEA